MVLMGMSCSIEFTDFYELDLKAEAEKPFFQ